MYTNSTDKNFYYCDGSGWVDLTAGAGAATAIDALADAGAGDDAVSLTDNQQTWDWDTSADVAFAGMTWDLNHDQSTDTTSQYVGRFRRVDSAGDHGNVEAILRLENLDTNDGATGLVIRSAASNIDLGIDVADTDFINAIRFAEEDDASTPTIGFGSTGNTGIYEHAADELRISLNASASWNFDGTYAGSVNTSGGSLLQGAGSLTTPYLLQEVDPDTGVGGSTTDAVSLVAGGSDGLIVYEGQAGTAAGDTIIELDDVGTAPTSNPGAGDLYVYVDGNSLWIRDSTGSTTDLGAGAGANSFETWNTDAGTNPVADNATDTVQLTSTDLTITGANDPESVTFAYAANSINQDELAASITFAAADNIVLPIEDAEQTVDGEIDFDTTAEVLEIGDDGAGTLHIVPSEKWTGDAAQSAAGAIDIATAAVDEDELASEDFGDFTCGAGADDCVLDAGVVDPTASTAAMKTESKCAWIEDPAVEVMEVVFRAPVAVTITEIYCETDAGTVGLDLQNDDGTPTGVNGSDISCASGGTSDTSFAGDAALAQNHMLDIDINSVTTATQVSVCWRYTYD
jgi:hypothetical protein